MVRNYQRRQLLIRVVSFVLSLLLLACCSVLPITQAKALAPVIAYGAKELVAALLVAGGATFATSDDARAAAGQVWDWLGQQASGVADKLQQIVALQIDVANTVGNGAVRISQSIWESIQAAYNALFAGSPGNLVLGQTYDLSTSTLYKDFLVEMSDVDWSAYLINRVDVGDITYYLDKQFYEANDTIHIMRIEPDGTQRVYLSLTEQKAGFIYFRPQGIDNGIKLYYRFHRVDGAIASNNIVIPYGDITFYSDSLAAPDLVYPGEDTMIYVPDIPEVQTDEEGKDVVIWPDLSLNPDDFVLDIPKTATGDLVDVPYDTLVDASTGTAVGEGEGTGTGEGEGTPSGTLPESGDLSLPKLIISKFPFCIPFDVATMIGQLNAEPEPLVVRIPVKTIDRIPTQYITIDFSQYESVIQVVRWGIYALFLAGLAYVTRNYIKW